ncbi:MAG: phosphoribosyltransferase domain-containing protein, partial [Deltaproteobacteria bacterium]|nr:phosphoribosyltransferase domain-containing protein [Deltaproteobacteria bacterium]
MFLVKGQKILLSEVTSSRSPGVEVSLRLNGPGNILHLCMGIDANNQASDHRFILFARRKVTPNGAMSFHGPAFGETTSYRINLDKVPPHIVRLVFAGVIAGPGSLNQLTYGHMMLTDPSGEVSRFVVSGDDFTHEKAVIMGELYLRQDEWRLSSVGQGFSGGLMGLYRHFGTELGDEPDFELVGRPQIIILPLEHTDEDGSEIAEGFDLESVDDLLDLNDGEDPTTPSKPPTRPSEIRLSLMLAPQSAGIENLTFYFPSGQLKVIVQKSNYLFSHLTAVAERYNLKRPFLFVSKVLGKHYPVRPSRVLDVHQKLAALMPPLLPPVVFIAMAETAVGLGRGVFESYTAQTKGTEALFTQTTRYALSHPLAFTIDEPHCHAPKHLVYQPVLESSRKIFNEAQSLVLIDDEITSGRTLSNLTLAYKALNPKCSQVHLVSITDWSDNSLLKKIARESNLKA